MVVLSVSSLPPTRTFSHALLSKEQTLQVFLEKCGYPQLTKRTKVTDDKGGLHDRVKLH